MIEPKFRLSLLQCFWFLVVLNIKILAQDCGAPGDVQYGEFAGSTLFGKDAQIVCWNGFTGGSAITCLAGDVWDALPSCSPIDCGSPTIPNGFLSSDTAYNDTTIISCNTGYQGGGRAFCLTSGEWYPLFPECKPVECWEPDIPNGRLSTGSDTVYDGTATVECDPGFEVTGSNAATCLQDGNWDTLPTCEPKDCGPPPISHGSLTSGSTTLYGGMTEVVCDTGYLGYGFATCLTTGLWDTTTLPACSPIDCGTPFVYHGFLTGTSNTVYDGSATIDCVTGYESGGTATCLDTGLWDEPSMPTCDPVDCGSSVDANGVLDGDSFFAGTASIACNTGYSGGGSITCQDTGIWDKSTATACTLVDCGSPGDPNGNLVGDSTYGGSASVTCNTGFVGGGQITCLPSGEWDKSLATTCVLADCGPLISPAYGDVMVTTTTYGSSATFACGPLYQMSGNTVLTCEADGTWSSAPPTCEDIDCPVLSAPALGFLSSSDITVGTNTYVYCNNGYSLFGLSPLTCQAGGTWDDDVGVCKQDCPSLVKPTYGTLSTTDVMEETVVEVTCDKGYTMFGDSIIECLAGGTWNTTVPDCVRECGSLVAPTYGIVSQPDGTTLDDVTTYNCSTGYYLSHTDSRVCQSDGSWSNTLATCIIYDCNDVLPPENGSVAYPTGTTYDQTLEYSCDTGYDLIGPFNRTCLSDGIWDLSDPYCEIRDCGPLANPTDGTVDTSEGTTYLSVAIFSCNLGYTMAGSATSSCEATAAWSDPPPVCNINDCGSLSNPVNGLVDYNATTYTSTSLYFCDTGYYLSGVNKRICQADSSWSDTEPTCIIKDCGLLDDPTDGTVTYSNSATTYQEVATFSCDTGFDLIGDVTRTCMDDGMWGGASPFCQIKDCGPLPDPVNGVVNTSAGTTYTEVANYSCDVGYNLVGGSQRICMDDGHWGGSAPICNIKDCGSLSDPADGVVSAPVTTYDATAVYSCTAGYYLIGVENRTCQQDASWSDTAPGCARKDCGEPPGIENGFYTISTGTQFGDTVVYSCDANYGLAGSATVGCLDTGEWSIPPSCSQDCGTPPTIDNGNFTTPSDSLLGAVVTYMCNDGYEMVRDENITCKGQGTWSKPPGCRLVTKKYNEECLVTVQCVTERATCRSEASLTRCLCSDSGQVYDASVDSCLADCGPLPDPVHGSVALPPVTAEGQIAVYSCDLNYALDLFDLSLAIRTCLSTGLWNGTAPECTEGCQPPVPPNHGYVSAPSGYARAYKIHYSCAPGYILDGDEDRDCLAATLYTGGEEYWLWGGSDPVCLIECPVLSDIENGNVDMSKGRTKGSIATYICENNYALIGKPVRKCLSTGMWKGVEPVCVIAIFPDILMAIGAVMIFLVILDILGILFCVYRKYLKKKKDKTPKYADYSEDEHGLLNDDFANNKLQQGMQRSSFRSSGPARASFRNYGKDTGMGADVKETGADEQMTPRIEQARSTLPRPPKPEDAHKQNYEDEKFPFELPYGSQQQFGFPNRNFEQTAETDFDNFLQREFQTQNFEENEFLGPNMDDDELSIDLPTNNVKDEKGNLKLNKKVKTDKRPITKLEDASTLFKGRISLLAGMRLNTDGERYYTEESRRHLKESVETYTPVNSNQPES